MSLTATETMREIQKYTSFRSFDEAVLLQIAGQLKTANFAAGQVVVEADQEGDKLYFLRSGVVEMLAQNERVGELRRPGEVIGELSSLSGRPTMVRMRAQTSVDCFVLNAHDFMNVDPAQKNHFEVVH